MHLRKAEYLPEKSINPLSARQQGSFSNFQDKHISAAMITQVYPKYTCGTNINLIPSNSIKQV
jgi:hypothetical protein